MEVDWNWGEDAAGSQEGGPGRKIAANVTREANS